MSNYENNPFSGDSENPFADPSVASMTTNAARGLEDFNPFVDQNVGKDRTQEKQPTTTPLLPPPNQPPSAQPAVLEPQQQPPPPPYVVEEEQENLRRRQEELERKAAELQRKEHELQRMQLGGYRESNFPPLPSKFPCKPCFFHDISIDIPIEYQKTCRALFFRWQAYSFTMFFNFIAAFALLVDGDDDVHGGENFGLALLFLIVNIPLSFLCWYRPAYNALNAMAQLISGAGSESDGITFGLSILYLIANVPLSFIFWYRPAYRAFKNDSSFSYVIFFLIFFIHIGLNIFYALGVPGSGACGFIDATQAIHHSVPVGAMMFASAILFTIGVCIDIYLLIRIHRIYRMAGASFEKAQGEFAKGVASNQQVQSAAAAGLRSAVTNQK